MPTQNTAHLEDLFNQRRYAAVMMQIAANETDPDLGALRADAQDYFRAGLNRISEIYQEICGSRPPTPGQHERLRQRYDQDVGAIAEPLEAEAYGRALLKEAERREAQGDHPEAQICIYAAGTLPIQVPVLRAQIQEVRMRLDGRAGNSHNVGTGQPSPFRSTTGVLPDTEPKPTRSPAPEALQPLLKNLNELLNRPMRDWHSYEATYEQQFQHLRAQVQRLPGDSIAALRDIDSRHVQLHQTLATIKHKLNQLGRARDDDLYPLLLDLEKQLGSDDPRLPPYQKRRDDYLVRLFQTLNELATMLRAPQVELDALQQRINDLRESTGKSPYTGLFARMNQQLAARQKQVTSFTALLQRPIQDWLTPTSTIHKQASDLQTEIATIFDADSALVKDLRARFNQRVSECRDVVARMQGLAAIEGAQMVSELAELEEVLGSSYAPLRPHQQRREQYKAEQQHQQELAKREARWTDLRHLRTELDTALKSYLSTPETFDLLREKARIASADPSLPLADHPVSPEIFAYYDVLCADYRYNLNTEALINARTAANMGDLIQSVKILENNLVEAKNSDNQRDEGLAQNALDKAIKDLIEQTQHEIATAIGEARVLLDNYDYAAALNTLNIQQTNLERTRNTLTVPITVDTVLIQKLEAALAEAKELEQRGQQADDLQQQAHAAAPEESDTPNYPQAIALLKQAASIASWRRSALDEAIAAFHQRQDKFVLQCIGRAATETRIENYSAAEEWLRRADLNVITEDQRRQIADQRTAIHDQQKNVERFDTIKNALQTLLDEIRKGENIERLRPRIAAYRIGIGPHDHPTLDDTRWAELDDYLRQAEAQIQAWLEYMILRRQAETAAINGEKEQVTHTLQQMSAMSAYTFLPIQQDTALIRGMVGIGERAERVRTLLSQIRDKLEQDEHAVTDDELDNAVRNSAGFSGNEYADIIQDRQFLADLLPLYRVRAKLKGYIEDSLFEQVEPAITALSQNIQEDPTIQHYKRDAAKRIVERDFQANLRDQLNGLKGVFDHAWDEPHTFQERIDSLSRFASQAAPDLRSTSPKLETEAIAQLNDLAAKVLVSRRQFDEKKYAGTQISLDAIIVMLPSSTDDTSKALASYSNELTGLRVRIETVKRDVHTLEQDEIKYGNVFDQALEDYQRTITHPVQCFNGDVLLKIINDLLGSKDSRATAYIPPLRAIIKLLKEVDSRFGTLTSTTDRKTLKEHLDQDMTTSRDICQPGGYAEDWPGIGEYPPYKILITLPHVVATLDAAEDWLRKTNPVPAKRSEQERLRTEGLELRDRLDSHAKQLETPFPDEEIIQPKIPTLSHIRAELQKTCAGQHKAIGNRIVDKIDQPRKQQTQQGKLTRNLVFVALALAAIFSAIWYVPTLKPVKEYAISLVMGTPVPTPIVPDTPTPAPEEPTWTPVVITATVPPSPTPIPPQAGVIVFPGRAWTYNKPSLGAERGAFIEGGLSIDVIGFTDDTGGSRWYKINAPDASLSNVWVLQQIVYEQDRQLRETVRLFDSNGLNEELFISYDQAMQ